MPRAPMAATLTWKDCVGVTRPAPVKTEKPLRIPVRRETMTRLETLARSRGRSVPAIAAERLLAAPIGER